MGFCAIERGPVIRGPWFPLRGSFFNCPVAGHSPGFNSKAPRGASKNIGLG